MSTYTTKDGVELNISGIKPLLLQRLEKSYRKSNPEPKKPTYIVDGLGGKEELPHNETTLTTEEDKIRWLQWKDQRAIWEAGLNERILHAILLKGVKNKFEINDEWIEEQEFLGIEVPESKNGRRILYIETEILSGEDIVGLTRNVMSLSGLGEEVLQEADKLFRSEAQGDSDNIEASTE